MMLLLGLAVASVIVLAIVVVPHGWNSWQSQQELKALREDTNGLAKQVDSLQDLQKDSLAANLDILISALPEEFDAAQVVSTIKQIAQEQQVEVSEVSVVVEENESAIGRGQNNANEVETQALQVVVRAPIVNLIKFLDGLDQTLPLLHITQLGSQVGEGEQAEDVMNTMLQANLKVDSYAWKMSTKKGPAENPELMTMSADDQRLLESLMQRRRYSLIPATNSGELERKNPFEL